MKIFFGISLVVLLIGWDVGSTAAHPRWKSAPRPLATNGYAVTSWYGLRFHGRYMASGERFNMLDPTIVAHKTLPLGTRVRITYQPKGPTGELGDKRSIVVRVLDRGPYIKGRAFDLSYAAARKLGLVGSGVARVHFEVIGYAPIKGHEKRRTSSSVRLFTLYS